MGKTKNVLKEKISHSEDNVRRISYRALFYFNVVLFLQLVLLPSVGLSRTIEIDIIEPETTYHALPKDINQKGTALALAGEKEMLGLAVSEAFYTLSMDEEVIRIKIGHTKHQVFLLNSLRRQVCLYEEAKAHEEKHVDISKEAMKKFKESLSADLVKMTGEKAPEESVKKHLRKRFKNLEEEVRQAQDEFDREDYKRIAKACK